MKRCVQCGQTLSDESAFCNNCGGGNFEPVAGGGDYQQPPVQQGGYYQQPSQQPNQQSYYQQPGQQPYFPQQGGAPYPVQNPAKGKAVASLVLGIIALVLCWWGWVGIVSIVLAVIGIILGVGARKELMPEQGRGMATGGLVCSIIALVLSSIVFVSCVICAAALTPWMY